MSLDRSCVGRTIGPYPFPYEDRDVILYALGVGATHEELRYVFEGADGFCTLPTFAVIPANQALFEAVALLNADLTRLLHGEQAIRWFRPIPTSGTLQTRFVVEGVYDKGKGALAVIRATSADEAGRDLFENTISLFIRGEGGFGGDPGPKAPKYDPPEGREPDFRVEQRTMRRQALLYRLSGDRNPLHASPEFAAAAGFERPILHGLCTLGFATRHFVNSALGGDPVRLKSLTARFSAVAEPWDTHCTEAWRVEEHCFHLRVTSDRGQTVITNFMAETA